MDAGALEALVDLLSDAQPDGQYSAAAALVNLTAVGQEVRAKIVDAGALPPLLVMLTAESWYVLRSDAWTTRSDSKAWLHITRCHRATDAWRVVPQVLPDRCGGADSATRQRRRP